MVGRVGPRWIMGWVAVDDGAPPVRVSLRVNNLEVTATWATGDGSALNNWGEVRRFGFRVQDLWRYVGPADRLTVRIDDRPLPINRHGMFVRPTLAGEHSFTDLKAELANGKVFSQVGRLQLSKQLDTEWQAQVFSLYNRVRDSLSTAHDRETFFIYGTLLGAVREGGFIGHDTDFDAAFISPHSNGHDAASELQQVAFTLIDAGLEVVCFRTALHIRDPATSSVRIDLFHLYFNEAGRLEFPFGVAGKSTFTRDDWQGTDEIDLPGGRGLLPRNAAALAEHLYGAGWREPNPGFNWARDRTHQAFEGFVPREVIEEIYWANFYARTEYTSGSSFFELVVARSDTPPTVIDIGCGDGRDSIWFAKSGRRVTGLDRSHIAIRHAGSKAESMGLADRLRFRRCDVGDADELRTRLSEAIAFGEGSPVVFYLRFFLHSIPEEVQENLLTVLAESARPGDVLAAEFRSQADEELEKTHNRHYRRFQDGTAFGVALRERFGFTVLDEVEGTGLAVYGDEDPVIYRVIARRES